MNCYRKGILVFLTAIFIVDIHFCKAQYYSSYQYIAPNEMQVAFAKAFLDRDGYIWFTPTEGRSDEFYRFDGNSFKFITELKNLDGFLAYGNYRNNARLDQDMEFWIGGNSGLLWLRNGEVYKHVDKNSGLINDTIIAFETCGKGIWVVQKGGLSFIKKSGNRIEIFNMPDSLMPPSIQVSTPFSENIFSIRLKTLNDKCFIAHSIEDDGTMFLHKIAFTDSVFFVEKSVKLPFEVKRLNEINNGNDLIGYSRNGTKLIYIHSDGTYEPIGEEYSYYLGEDKNRNAFFCIKQQDGLEIIRGHITDFIENFSAAKSNAYFKYRTKLNITPPLILNNTDVFPDVFYINDHLVLKRYNEDQEYLLSEYEIIKTKTTYRGMYYPLNKNRLWSSKWQTNDAKLITYNPNIKLHQFSNDINGLKVYSKTKDNSVIVLPRYLSNRYTNLNCLYHTTSNSFKFLDTNERNVLRDKNNKILRDKNNNIWISDQSNNELEKISTSTKYIDSAQNMKVKFRDWWVLDQEGGVYFNESDSTFIHLINNSKYTYSFPFKGELFSMNFLSNNKLVFKIKNWLYVWDTGKWYNIDLPDTTGFRIIDDNNYSAVILFNSTRCARVTENNELKFYDDFFEIEKYKDFTFSQTDKLNRTFFLHKNSEGYISEILMLEENGKTKQLPFAKPVNVLERCYTIHTPKILDDSNEIIYLLNNDIYIFNDSIGYFYKIGSTKGYLTYIWDSFIDGKLYISGWGNYILEVNLKNINYKLPEIILRNVVLNDNTNIYRPEEKIELKKNQSIDFQYFSTDEYITKDIEYQTKLVGLDSDWKSQLNRSLVNYTHLPPGEFTFMVRVIGENRIWSKPVSYSFTVIPSWYQSNIAYIAYLILFLAILYLIVKISTWRLKRKNILLEARVKIKTEQIINQRAQVEEMKNQFYTNISHEFRTPLTLINGNAEQLEMEATKPKQKRMLHSIRNASHRVLKLVNEMLDLSKLEAGKFTLAGQRGNVVETIKLVWQMYISEAERNGIKYTFDFNRKEILFWHDKDVLEKILHNLISNALKYTEKGGSVHIQTEINKDSKTHKEQLKITIKDTGIGIPANELGKIFERYYQTTHKLKRVTPGTGVGLALVKELVELHKGSIQVNSNVESGTEFSLYFPMDLENSAQTPAISENEKNIYHIRNVEVKNAETIGTGKLTEPDLTTGKSAILVVEDNNDLREHITDVLHDHYKIYEAESGEKGLKLAIEKFPELVLSDVMMPGMDGEEMCKKIKENSITGHIPVVLLTAKADKESKIKGLELGADDYITKPFDREELLARIKNLIKQRRNLRQKFSSVFIDEKENLTSNRRDDELINRIIKYVHNNIDRTDTNVEHLCREVGMSQPNLYRKIKAITNFTPSEFIRFIKIKYSVSLLESGNTVSEAAYASGFNSVAYFSKCFKKLMGQSPGVYTK